MPIVLGQSPNPSSDEAPETCRFGRGDVGLRLQLSIDGLREQPATLLTAQECLLRGGRRGAAPTHRPDVLRTHDLVCRSPYAIYTCA